MTTIINAVSGTGLTQSADGSGIIKLQSNGKTTNALAWVNFNGTNGSIRAAYNVSSVTRSGTGTYVLNFTTAMSDNNYTVMASGGSASGVQYGAVTTASATPTTTQASLVAFNTAPTVIDMAWMYAAVFGN